MNKKLHTTVGIPAFNEEGNIGELLDALSKQKGSSFILDKIIVISDGSTDRTPIIVRNFSKLQPIVSCIPDPKRRGVRYRTQQLLKVNKSEILVFFDGDTRPNDRYILNRLVSVFKDESVQLATANLKPVYPTTKFEYLLYSWRGLWSAVTETWKNGNNIYNFRGVGIAIRKSYTKSVKIPKNITGASSHYLYLSAKMKSLRTAFVKTAVIKYCLAKSFEDYRKQLNRGQNDRKLLKSLFSQIYKSEYTIPLTLRLSVILKQGLKNPIKTFIGIVFNTIIQLINRGGLPSDKNGIWEIAKSTKETVAEI